jgi:hypothetical protein
MMEAVQPTRRQFLSFASALMVATLVGHEAGAQGQPGQHRAVRRTQPPRIIYRLSCRGRRSSNAAKQHNANLRFASIDVAARHHAHAGDTSRVVPLTVSQAEYERLFFRHLPGRRRRVFVPVADLRHLQPPA